MSNNSIYNRKKECAYAHSSSRRSHLSLLLRISPAEPHNNHLWFIIQPDIDRVSPKSPSDDHPALFFSFSRKFKISRASRIKKLVLGCHDSAHKRKPDGSAMKMSGKCEIRSPRRILLKNSGEWARRRQNFSGSGSPRVSFKRPSGISPDRGR